MSIQLWRLAQQILSMVTKIWRSLTAIRADLEAIREEQVLQRVILTQILSAVEPPLPVAFKIVLTTKEK
jgi:hypothetical protein